MNFFHCPIKIVSRNKGRSAVASAAYISGTRLENTWDGTTHDYTRKQHIIHSEIMLPANAPPQYMDRATLWNSVEWNETDRNAQLARVFEIALPAELSHEQNIALARKIVQDLFVSKGMCADFGVHDKKDGNPHVHIMLTMRAIQEDGRWAPKASWCTIWMLTAIASRQSRKAVGKLTKKTMWTGTIAETPNCGVLPLPIISMMPCVKLVLRRALSITGVMPVRVLNGSL